MSEWTGWVISGWEIGAGGSARFQSRRVARAHSEGWRPLRAHCMAKDIPARKSKVENGEVVFASLVLRDGAIRLG